ncbi:MAG: hypothetical protein JWO37_4089 [Acidimicrobiales bacterium]|jgi:hypothetical protein|nr:hypothetical protein [Acidimicrobiales bacterium]
MRAPMSAMVQWVRRLCFATSAVCLVAAVVPSGAHADPVSDRPTVFVGYAAAAAIHQQFDKVGGVAATAEPIYTGFPEALSVFGNDLSSGRASTYYPGATVPGLGGIGCNQVPGVNQIPGLCPVPAYPLSVTVPTTDGKTDASSTGSQTIGAGGPLTITATSAVAHADRVYASAAAENGGAKQGVGAANAAAVLAFRKAVALATGGPLAAAKVQADAADSNSMTVGGMQATSRVSFPDPKTPALLVATAQSVANGVDLLGGQIHVNSVTTTSVYRTDGVSPPVHDNTVTVSGVTAGGQPAVIDNNGITVLGANQGKPVLDAINNALHDLFVATGSGLRLVNATAPSDGKAPPAALSSESFAAACGKGEADGLQFFQTADANRVPNGGIFYLNATIGSACTDASASPQRGLLPELPTIPDLPPVGAGSVALPDNSGSVATPAADTGSAAGGTAASGSNRAATSKQATTGSGGRTLGSLEASFGRNVADRLGWLYFAFTFAFVALCLGTRLFMPARLPRHR